MTAHQLAENEGIPEPSLRKVLPLLRRAGLVETERGMRGGHRLSRPPDRISILDVCDALDMYWSRNLCPFGKPRCKSPDKCSTISELAGVTNLLRQILSKQTIAMCCEGRR